MTPRYSVAYATYIKLLPVKGFEPNQMQSNSGLILPILKRGVNDTVQCHPYPYRYRPAKICSRSPPPALYNTVVGWIRNAHATELYRLHFFDCKRTSPRLYPVDGC